MRTVVRTKEGVLELNFMWLPTWIGMNGMLKASLEEELRTKIVGMTMEEEDLDKIDSMVIDFLVAQSPFVVGLREYLEGMKFVEYQAESPD